MSYLEFNNIFPGFNFMKPLFDRGLIQYREWSKGEIVLHCNTTLESLYFITSGRARAYKPLSNGKDVIYAPYGPGDIAGDVEYIVDMEATGSLISVDNLKGFIIRKAIIPNDLSNKFYQLIAQGVTKKLISASQYNAVRVGYTLEERLAFYCLYQYEDKIYSMEELAGTMGTTYRHLSRVFKKFSDKNYIRIIKNKITIIDRENLMDLATEISEDLKLYTDK